MIDPASISLAWAIPLFIAAAIVIGIAGTRIASLADRLADLTGWGEAIFGAVFLGAGTSLPGVVTSVVAASDGHAELAFGNAIGGIAAQTGFLAVADMCYRKVNLEHAAASVVNLMQGTLLTLLLILVVMIMTGPDISLAGVHVGSPIILIAYIYGIRMINRERDRPMWNVQQTPETVIDEPNFVSANAGRSLIGQWIEFIALALVLIIAGYTVAKCGVAISIQTGLSETIVGTIFTAVVTSLPELVTSIAAVRIGALTLAVGNIIGGNSFEVLFMPAADVAYRSGSIYHALGQHQIFVAAWSGLLIVIMLLGLLRREKYGIGTIGFESAFVLLCYVSGVVIISF